MSFRRCPNCGEAEHPDQCAVPAMASTVPPPRWAERIILDQIKMIEHLRKTLTDVREAIQVVCPAHPIMIEAMAGIDEAVALSQDSKQRPLNAR